VPFYGHLYANGAYITTGDQINVIDKGGIFMALPAELDFAAGVRVNIRMLNGVQYSGELIDAVDNYLLLRLIDAPAPINPANYEVGQVVRLDSSKILIIG
jgi:hypothetical protein